MRMKTVAASLALALAASGGLAQKQSPPPAGPPKDFRVPTPVELRLDNGLEVTLVEYGTVPKVTVELSILAGNGYERANQIWLADLTGNLIREGTTTKSATAISKAAARMGGSLDVAVGVNAAEINGDVLSEFGPEM